MDRKSKWIFGISAALFATLSMTVDLNIRSAKASDLSTGHVAAEKPVDTKSEKPDKDNTFYYCADRTSFPPDAKYFDYDSRPWKEEEKACVSRLLDEIKKNAPGVVALASVHGKIPLLKTPYIPYKNILGKTTSAYVLAVDSAIFIADGAEQQKDLKRILLHELVHMADLGRHVAYSQEWASFAQPSLQRARRQVSCQFLLDSKAEDFADSRWPSTESCTSYKESLCEFTSKYVLDPKFKKDFKSAKAALEPLLHPGESEMEFARHYMDGRIYFRSEKPSEAIIAFESALKFDELAPAPHVFLAQCWYEKGENEKARDQLKKAKELFERAKISITESLHWRTLSMLANSFALLKNFDEAKTILDRLACSHIQYDPTIFQRRSLCNEKLDDLRQAMLDVYEYEYMMGHAAEPAHYFDFIEDQTFLQNFLAKKFQSADGRRSHVFSVCWERLALASTGNERSKCIQSALAEVGKASSSGYYSKDEETVRKRYLDYLSGNKPTDYEKLTEHESSKKLSHEFDLLRYLSGKSLPAKGSDEFAALLKHIGPTDAKETKWLF